MKVDELKKRNIRNIFTADFFGVLSTALIAFFLPYFLKEKGLSILQIGGLFTIAIAAGGLIISLIYSKIIKNIKLKNGLAISSFIASFQNLFLFFIPTSFGVFGSKVSNLIGGKTGSISRDVALQHNIPKKGHRTIGSYSLIIDGFAESFGILLAILLITYIGFKYSFLAFFSISLIPIYFYLKVDDKTRFKLKNKVKIPKLSKYLKLFIFSELVYWLALSASFDLVVTFLVTDRLSSSFAWIGYLFIALYVSIAITTLLSHKFLDKKDLTKTSIIGMFVLFLSAMVIIFSTNIWIVLGAFVLEGVGAAIWVPSKVAIIWKLTQKENREKVSGYISGFRGITSALGPITGGLLVTAGGILAPFYFKAGLSILVIGIYIYILRKTKELK
ncbi:MAG: MFS transporter [Candidatus Pacearchaeota archaeon]